MVSLEVNKVVLLLMVVDVDLDEVILCGRFRHIATKNYNIVSKLSNPSILSSISYIFN